MTSNSSLLQVLLVIDCEHRAGRLSNLLQSNDLDVLTQFVNTVDDLNAAMALRWDLIISCGHLRTQTLPRILQRHGYDNVAIICLAEQERDYRFRSVPAITHVVDDSDELAIIAAVKQEIENSHHMITQNGCDRSRSLHHDSLTQLLNRSQFLLQLEKSLSSAQRLHKKVGLIAIDLDRFKNINEALGHLVGDHLLKEVAARIRRAVFVDDIVARIGNDEFSVILPLIDSENDIAAIANRIQTAITNPMTIEGHELFMSASMGAVLSTDGIEHEHLVVAADKALHASRIQANNLLSFYRESMLDDSYNECQLEHDLHRALGRQELVLHYQPKVDVESGLLVGAEALVRWNHPTRGFLGPDSFIDLLEHTHLMERVGEWVLRSACWQWQQWRNEDVVPAKSQVSVNLSPAQFTDNERLLSLVSRVIDETGLPAHCLDLEITEGMLIDDVESCQRLLIELKALGCTISVDDFGTGYSSLSYLKKFPIDYLKIDKSFVSDVTRDQDDASIASAIIDLAHNLRMKVIAEGVECAATLRFLSTKRCDFYQGYHYSKPQGTEAFRDLLLKNKTKHLGAKQAPASVTKKEPSSPSIPRLTQH